MLGEALHPQKLEKARLTQSSLWESRKVGDVGGAPIQLLLRPGDPGSHLHSWARSLSVTQFPYGNVGTGASEEAGLEPRSQHPVSEELDLEGADQTPR